MGWFSRWFGRKATDASADSSKSAEDEVMGWMFSGDPSAGANVEPDWISEEVVEERERPLLDMLPGELERMARDEEEIETSTILPGPLGMLWLVVDTAFRPWRLLPERMRHGLGGVAIFVGAFLIGLPLLLEVVRRWIAPMLR